MIFFVVIDSVKKTFKNPPKSAQKSGKYFLCRDEAAAGSGAGVARRLTALVPAATKVVLAFMNDNGSAKDGMCDGAPQLCHRVGDVQLHYPCDVSVNIAEVSSMAFIVVGSTVAKPAGVEVTASRRAMVPEVPVLVDVEPVVPRRQTQQHSADHEIVSHLVERYFSAHISVSVGSGHEAGGSHCLLNFCCLSGDAGRQSRYQN